LIALCRNGIQAVENNNVIARGEYGILLCANAAVFLIAWARATFSVQGYS
jgi:hypothetical protein